MAYQAIMLKGTAESITPVLKHLYIQLLLEIKWYPNGMEKIIHLCPFQKVQSQQVTESVTDLSNYYTTHRKQSSRKHVYNLVWEYLEITGQIPDSQWEINYHHSAINIQHSV